MSASAEKAMQTDSNLIHYFVAMTRSTTLLFFLISALLIGCGSAPASTPPTPIVADTNTAESTNTESAEPSADSDTGTDTSTDNGYPIDETATVDDSYPISNNTVATNIIPESAGEPEFDASTGALTGQFIYANGTEQPVRGQIFMLAVMLPVTGGDLAGEAFIPMLDPDNPISSSSDKNGNVTISNVPPEKYALALMTPQGPVLIPDLNGEDILVEIFADGQTDLGKMEVNLNPDVFEPEQ